MPGRRPNRPISPPPRPRPRARGRRLPARRTHRRRIPSARSAGSPPSQRCPRSAGDPTNRQANSLRGSAPGAATLSAPWRSSRGSAWRVAPAHLIVERIDNIGELPPTTKEQSATEPRRGAAVHPGVVAWALVARREGGFAVAVAACPKRGTAPRICGRRRTAPGAACASTLG